MPYATLRYILLQLGKKIYENLLLKKEEFKTTKTINDNYNNLILTSE